jgi:hypothetical protein
LVDAAAPARSHCDSPQRTCSTVLAVHKLTTLLTRTAEAAPKLAATLAASPAWRELEDALLAALEVSALGQILAVQVPGSSRRSSGDFCRALAHRTLRHRVSLGESAGDVRRVSVRITPERACLMMPTRLICLCGPAP